MFYDINRKVIRMKNVYPVLVKRDDDWYLAYIPDIEQAARGRTLYEATTMARDLLGTYSLLKELPEPKDAERAIRTAVNKTEYEDFTMADGQLVYVDIDTDEYSLTHDKREVRRTVSLPAWLDERAEEEGIDLSLFLQEALIEKVGPKQH